MILTITATVTETPDGEPRFRDEAGLLWDFIDSFDKQGRQRVETQDRMTHQVIEGSLVESAAENGHDIIALTSWTDISRYLKRTRQMP